MPKVSIIVPIYNVEKYIEKCLDSLACQTLEDIEVILVNDGSTDNSKEKVLPYIEKYPDKFQLFEKENGGLSDARNFGMRYAKGEYIAFLDSDDYVEPDMYEKMYEKAKEENADMVECDFYWEYPDRKVESIGEIYTGKKEMLEKARVMAWNKLWKKELLEKTKIEFPKGLRYEDIEFFYCLIPEIEKVGFVKKTLVHYMQRENSITYTQNEKTADIFTIFENIFKEYEKRGLEEEYREELEYTYARTLLCRSLLRIVRVGDKKVRKQLEKRTWEELNKRYPDWRKNKILKKGKKMKERYMKTVNSLTFHIYTKLFRILKIEF